MASVRLAARAQFEDALRKDPQYIAALERAGEVVAQHAQQIAPVNDGDYSGDKATIDTPGQYRDSIHVETRTGATGRRRVAVVSNDYKALWIEKGTEVRKRKSGASMGRMPKYGVLRKAARLAGLKVRGKR